MCGRIFAIHRNTQPHRKSEREREKVKHFDICSAGYYYFF